jgi:hypothetical protein
LCCLAASPFAAASTSSSIAGVVCIRPPKRHQASNRFKLGLVQRCAPWAGCAHTAWACGAHRVGFAHPTTTARTPRGLVAHTAWASPTLRRLRRLENQRIRGCETGCIGQ